MIFSCFSLTAYDLAVAPFARTNCLNQIMVCIPIAVVNYFKVCAEKYLAFCLFPGEDAEQLFGQGAPAAQLRETHRDRCRGGRCRCHNFCNSVLTLPWHLSMQEVQRCGIALFGLSKYASSFQSSVA